MKNIVFFGVQPLNNTHSAIYENNSLGKSVLPGELKKLL